MISEEAKSLHQQGRELGQEGNYDEAVRVLKDAARLAPDWPYPVYDLAFTYLLKQDFEQAYECYCKTDEMAPEGFFISKTSVWALQKEREGVFPKGLYFAFMQIEWLEDKVKEEQILQNILKNFPDYAPAWKSLAHLLTEEEARFEALEKGLASNPDVETKGNLLINKAIILFNRGEQDLAKQMLTDLISDKEATHSNRTMAEHVQKQLH